MGPRGSRDSSHTDREQPGCTQASPCSFGLAVCPPTPSKAVSEEGASHTQRTAFCVHLGLSAGVGWGTRLAVFLPRREAPGTGNATCTLGTAVGFCVPFLHPMARLQAAEGGSLGPPAPASYSFPHLDRRQAGESRQRCWEEGRKGTPPGSEVGATVSQAASLESCL